MNRETISSLSNLTFPKSVILNHPNVHVSCVSVYARGSTEKLTVGSHFVHDLGLDELTGTTH